jgi:hypothetical protein
MDPRTGGRGLQASSINRRNPARPAHRSIQLDPRRIATLQTKPVLHGDNGSTLKATTVLAMLQWLGVKLSYSRPRVSDDNAYAESLFRTPSTGPSSRPQASQTSKR